MKFKYYNYGGVLNSVSLSLPNTAETGWNWRGAAAGPTNIAGDYSFGTFWSADVFTAYDGWNTSYFGTGKSYNNDIVSAMSIAVIEGLTVTDASGNCIPNQADHVAYTEVVNRLDSDPSWTFTFENTSDDDIIIDTITTLNPWYGYNVSNAVVAGLKIGPAETQDLIIDYDVSAADANDNAPSHNTQEIAVVTSKGTYYINLTVQFTKDLLMPVAMKVTLGSAWKGTHGLSESEVITLKPIHLKPSEQNYSSQVLYSESGSWFANTTDNRIVW
ncbi:unnamed protein product, partial [marine sediment metagenome]